MANQTIFLFSFPLFIVVYLLHVSQQSFAHPFMSCRLDKIYQLGDSISDTGNLIRETPLGAALPFARLPYGQTTFKHATGRCSDGLLMIDNFALAAGLPLLNPYKDQNADLRHGANFAVAGSTALSTRVLGGRKILSPVTNSSLDVQLQWMSTHFNSICPTHRDCAEKLRNALFMVGEVGGNDYNYALFQGKSIEEAKSMVADVVRAISNAVRRVIEHGAARVIVPGNFPIGCFPIYLTAFQTNNSDAYDEFHCLKDLNDFSIYHNDHLKHAIDGLRKEHPNAIIVYGDYYNAFQWLFRNAPFIGFETNNMQKSCCGIGGDYNFNMTRMCGFPGVPVCSDAHRYISWDGVHLTQEAYKFMSRWLLHDIFPRLHCLA